MYEITAATSANAVGLDLFATHSYVVSRRRGYRQQLRVQRPSQHVEKQSFLSALLNCVIVFNAKRAPSEAYESSLYA